MKAPFDTAPDIEARYRRMMLAKSPSERVVMACGMLDVARATILAALPDDADEASRPVLLFKRLYGKDFDSATARRILVRLTQ
jgi:hypothetical protein